MNISDASPASIADSSPFLYQTIVIVNFCCGLRREGDIQFHIEDIIQDIDLEIYVLSIDIGIDANRANLLSSSAIDFWLGLISNRKIAGGFMQPPCETWTSVRAAGDGPPPLRNCEFP